MDEIRIAGRPVGPGHPCFVIAEAGVNHDGSVDDALRLVDAAADAGADAVKFQTFRADRLATRAAPKAAYQARETGADESQHAMLRRLELSPEAHRLLKERCEARGIVFLSTPFDEESADLLAELGVPAFKLPSGELTNLPLLAHVARFGRPVILSTGMARMGEIEAALDTLRGEGARETVVLHCVSRYPAEPGEANLRAMETLSRAFGVPIGYSDHTMGLEVPLAAAALGATVLEKHFTLSRERPGPDHRASLEPGELAALVRGIRAVESALGHGRKEPVEGEADTARAARRSVVAARDLPEGAELAGDDLALRRPGTGLAPSFLPLLVGRRLRRALAEGDLVSLDALA